MRSSTEWLPRTEVNEKPSKMKQQAGVLLGEEYF